MAQARKKILGIEDDRETAALIAEELIVCGFEVSTAYGGEEGLLAIMKATADLVLCDISMPTMTGFVFTPEDPVDLAKVIERYFASDLYPNLNNRRHEIRNYATDRHSWDVVGELTCDVYGRLLGRMDHASGGINSHSCGQRARMDR